MEEHHPQVRQDQAQTPLGLPHPGVILTAQTSYNNIRLGGQTSQTCLNYLKLKKLQIFKFVKNFKKRKCEELKVQKYILATSPSSSGAETVLRKDK